jgi:hypothetical protein
LDFEEILPAGLGKNLPHSIKGMKVTTVPAAAISFRKSRRDTFLPELGGLCCVIVLSSLFVNIREIWILYYTLLYFRNLV